MSKFEWIKRARNATTVDEVKQIMTELNKARFTDSVLSEEAYNTVFYVCYDKLIELK